MNKNSGEQPEIERETKIDPLATHRLRARFGRERQVNEAEAAAGAALAAVERAAADLSRRCADAAEAKLKLVEAETKVAHLSGGEQKAKLQESLKRARAAVEEISIVCHRIPRE
jgi:hypothetical protein